jgi:hypothetical protein
MNLVLQKMISKSLKIDSDTSPKAIWDDNTDISTSYAYG